MNRNVPPFGTVFEKGVREGDQVDDELLVGRSVELVVVDKAIAGARWAIDKQNVHVIHPGGFSR